MKYMNLGCGSNRPDSKEWVNVDDIYAIFPNPGCPERINLSNESNYANCDVRKGFGDLFSDGEFDGILASHILEHFTLNESLFVLEECRRVLKSGGILRISLPDPVKFYVGTLEGKKDWGEHFPHEGEMSFMRWALFFHEHNQIIGREALDCILLEAGFATFYEVDFQKGKVEELNKMDNRPQFSFFYEAING